MSTELTTYQGSALSPANLEHSSTLAVRLSKSDLLPPHFKGKPENVLLVLALAQNLDINPVMCLQQVSVIGGKPCLQATLMISLLNKSGKITGPLRFRWDGEAATARRSCVAFATDTATGEIVESEPVSLAMAQAEGWTRNAKYKSIPDTMLKWRAASFFVRTYYPEVVLGLHSSEELDDVQVAASSPSTGSARDRLAQIREAQHPPIVRDVEPQPEQPPAIEATVETPAENAPESESMTLLADFLDGVAACEDSDELAAMVQQANDFEGPARKTARVAIKDRADWLGFVWDESAKTFIKPAKA